MAILTRRMFDMLKDGVMTDVIFIIQGTEIKGHSDIVSSHGGPLSDHLKTKPEKMKISDISPHTFRMVLEYIYTDHCEVHGSNVFELMHVAMTFLLKDLERRCTDKIKTIMSVTNIGVHTAEALNFNSTEYLHACQEYFRNNSTKSIETQEFLEISGEVLSALCSSERINCTELSLFTACVKWAKHKCCQQNREATSENLRSMLGDALSKIRFPCIPFVDFQRVVIPTGILSFEEVGDIAVGYQKKAQKSRYSYVNRAPGGHQIQFFGVQPVTPNTSSQATVGKVMVSLDRRMFDMLNNNIMTDVTFVIEGTEIKAHRSVTGSSGGLLKDLLETKVERIELDDIAASTFRTVLEYLYTDRCSIGPANVFELVKAARKLHLENLEVICASEIKTKLSPTNVCEFATEALDFDFKEYFDVCIEYFQKDTIKVIEMQEFLEISGEVLSVLCCSERIECTELGLFSACVKWAKHKCGQQNQEATPENLRSLLGDALSKIRFPCIPMADFQEHVIPLEVLTSEEVGEVLVGWQMPNIKSRFSNVHRQVIEVTIAGYSVVTLEPAGKHKDMGHRSQVFFGGSEHFQGVVRYESTCLHLPLSTKISQLKNMKIFDGGKQEYPTDKFTLRYYMDEYRDLADDVTLVSIYTPGQHLTLQFGSFTFTVRDIRTQLTYPLSMNLLNDLQNIDNLRFFIKIIFNKNPSSVDFPNVYPGATINVGF